MVEYCGQWNNVKSYHSDAGDIDQRAAVQIAERHDQRMQEVRGVCETTQWNERWPWQQRVDETCTHHKQDHQALLKQVSK